MSQERQVPAQHCAHEWAPTGVVVHKPGRTIGSRCIHCGRYSYRPSPSPEPRWHPRSLRR